ncbi:MAG: hypothetical protein Q8S73_21600 [Deltaproteobacteria bacterium]|nr:hypothetical protein [Myxococcales bacterium]MDP3216720.1 hypothetical protein [Deltaproteobacteria bacterium]
MTRTIASLFLLAVVGCSGQQGMRSDIPAAGRPLWDRCRPSVDTWCHNRAQGDPTLERECEGNTGHDYGLLADDAARQQFLRAHGCSL